MEAENAIKKLKPGKSPGLDGVPIDLFKSLMHDFSSMLVTLFNYVLEEGSYPDLWSTGLINPVPKVYNPESTDKFRRISVLPSVSKILEYIINNRFMFLETALCNTDFLNGGFREDSMCSDNVFVLSGLIEKHKILKKPLFVCYVDFKRAFDCLNRIMMFTKLIHLGYSMYCPTWTTALRCTGLCSSHPMSNSPNVQFTQS